MTKIILKDDDAAASTPGHLIRFGETPADAALRIAPYLARNDECQVVVTTDDPMVFEIETIVDEARLPTFDEDGELESESYDLSRHPGAVGLAVAR